MITETYSETLAVAANERKKLEVIVTTLSHMVKQQLIVFLKDLKSEIIPCVRHDEGINHGYSTNNRNCRFLVTVNVCVYVILFKVH